MKTFIGAIALIIAAPVVAQTAPAADPHAGHAQHQGMDHSQHSQGKHDCKECCEKMKGKDGKMECMDKKADAKPADPEHSHEGARSLIQARRRSRRGGASTSNEAALDPVPWYGVPIGADSFARRRENVGASRHPAEPAIARACASWACRRSPLRTSAQATLHCLTGCVIGEVAGLAIGVSLGLGIWPTIILATVLAYATGITLGLLPVMRSRHVGLVEAFRIIWIGEVISIGVMEIVMNFVDYQMGGMGAPSVASWMFWRGILFAVPAGFLAAWPVNYWLLRRDLKACH